jgi:hypothetical protein
MDRYVFYRFCFDDQNIANSIISIDDKRVAESELQQSLSTLAQLAPDAIFRQILRKMYFIEYINKTLYKLQFNYFINVCFQSCRKN